MGDKKRGQMKLSFGMIFSIILIVIFLSFAFWAIMQFLDLQESAQVGKFKNEFQDDVTKIWKSSSGSQEEEYSLPSAVEMICFTDYESSSRGKNSAVYSDLELAYYGSENFFVYPIGSGQGLNSAEIKHINISAITKDENPFCIENNNGISLTLKKDFGEALVTIER